MRRTFIIILGVILSIAILGGIYFFFFARPGAHLTVGGSFSDTSSGTVAPQSNAPIGETAQSAGTQVAPNLVEITSSPVADGFASFDIVPTYATSTSFATGSTTASIAGSSTPGDVAIRYIDRESGNIYQYGALSRTLTRLSDKTLPGIQEASWLPDGSIAFTRFIVDTNGSDQLDTYALPFNGNGGYFLQQDLDEAVVTPSNLLFTLAAGTDSSIGTILNTDGTNPQTIFNSPLAALDVYPTSSGYIAVTKAAAELQGYAFAISPAGAFTPILGPLDGLTVLPSPSGKLILYSYIDGTTLHMGVFDTSDGSTTALPVATITEKCVWASDESSIYCAIPTSFSGTLPDDWYQGVVSFNDRIWNINLSSRLATLVLDPTSSVKGGIDAIGLTLDPNSEILTFMNKRDGSLWAYSL